MAILAYLFFFVPLLVGAHKTSPFVRFHTNQGTVLFICGVIYGVAYPILSIILALIPIIGWIIIFLLGLAGIMFLVWLIMGIVNASQGQLKPLPFIGKFEIVK